MEGGSFPIQTQTSTCRVSQVGCAAPGGVDYGIAVYRNAVLARHWFMFVRIQMAVSAA